MKSKDLYIPKKMVDLVCDWPSPCRSCTYWCYHTQEGEKSLLQMASQYGSVEILSYVLSRMKTALTKDLNKLGLIHSAVSGANMETVQNIDITITNLPK